VLFGLPLLLLQNAPAYAHSAAAAPAARAHGASSPSRLDGVNLPSHLVLYQAAATTTTVAAVTPATPVEAAPTTTTAAPQEAPRVVAPTTTTMPAPPQPTNSEVGEATWYSQAPAGKCASPNLPFGTVLTVRNNATGATTTCTVDDREESGYPRVVDLSPSDFAQIADPSQGVVDVTISW